MSALLSPALPYFWNPEASADSSGYLACRSSKVQGTWKCRTRKQEGKKEKICFGTWPGNRSEKNKKKSTVTFLSLAVSLSVFYCLTTLISSHGTRTVAANYWDADLTIRNSTQTAEDINSLKPALDGIFLEALKKIEGIRELHKVEGAPVTFPEDGFFREWLQNYAGSRPIFLTMRSFPSTGKSRKVFTG